ncbi:MAG: hypothetical protein CMJ41_00365 [Phycisphaerae bacterium]|nr:hypothetical protein [Phycisphaerae bacterium]
MNQPQPRFHAYEPKTTMPFFSTRSLAIASLVVAGCGVIAALSPLLFPAFLPIAMLGMVLAVCGLFSYRDRSTLQVAAMSFNGLLVLVALLRGPVALQSVEAAEFEPWSPSIAMHDSQQGLPGWVLRGDRIYADGRRSLDLVLQWDLAEVAGCWNWFKGDLVFRNTEDGRTHEVEWSIEGPIHDGAILTQGCRVPADGNLAWIAETPMDEIEISFMPVEWEHSAFQRHNGVLVPAGRMPAAQSRAAVVRGAR